MTDFTLPTTEQIELMASRDLIMNYNHFAPTAGQNTVKKFQDRQTGIKRLTAVADALRAQGVTEAAPATEFPLIVRPNGERLDTPALDALRALHGYDSIDEKIVYTTGPMPGKVTVENSEAEGFPITGQFHDDNVKATIEFDPSTATEAELLANGYVELIPVPDVPKAKKNGKKTLIAPAKTPTKVELTGDAAPKAKKAASVKTASGKPNLSARLREEINRGLDNAAVWAIIQPEFKLDDNKKGYVAGQRRAMEK